jgi:hypothetical protein
MARAGRVACLTRRPGTEALSAGPVETALVCVEDGGCRQSFPLHRFRSSGALGNLPLKPWEGRRVVPRAMPPGRGGSISRSF